MDCVSDVPISCAIRLVVVVLFQKIPLRKVYDEHLWPAIWQVHVINKVLTNLAVQVALCIQSNAERFKN